MAPILRVVGALLVGAVIAAVGTVVHRSSQPWGLVLALSLVLMSAVALRAGGGRSAAIGHLAGLLAGLLVLTEHNPGGDVLLPAGDNLGWFWLGGAAAVSLAVAAAPQRWFADVPLRRTPTP